MNWLAHVFLSEPGAAFRLGSLLPDLVSSSLLVGLSAEFQRGIRRHRSIDVFTDRHPVVRRSIWRLQPPFRRYGGILTDILYDHFLARDWAEHAVAPLPEFAADVYASFDRHWDELPGEAHFPLSRIREDDLLCSYRELSGIHEALWRLSHRLRRPFDLSAAMPLLEENYEALRMDFREFFPELQRHVAAEAHHRGAEMSRGGGEQDDG